MVFCSEENMRREETEVRNSGEDGGENLTSNASWQNSDDVFLAKELSSNRTEGQ